MTKDEKSILQRMEDKIDKMTEQFIDISTNLARHDEKIKAQEKLYEKLHRVILGGGVSVIAAVIADIIMRVLK